MNDSRPPKNVINMKERRQTLKRKPKADKKGTKAGKGPSNNSNITWAHYLQFFLFIGVLAYFMRTCSG